ncbi:pantothenate kinase [Azotobacter chroococcum]|uniref:pantothenate kinase n=1 Tax=Azotobacter chroococcum TaxID=353 RepID=UPI0010394240|nr:pantothenate kinase [Azotobacter chroococcum]TBW34147.1 pantothenate kinase [Azotobacter chroococcum]
MIIELDCGNSFIKWRIIGAASQVLLSGVVGSTEELIRALEGARVSHELYHCRMVSVRSDEETACLEQCLAQKFGLRVLTARPASCLAGVRNGYVNYESLGLDRWMAVIAAYHLSAGACLVLDLGTAVTADFVAANGDHKGGFICPGLPLLRSQLRTHTRRIHYDAVASNQFMAEPLAPGRSTAEAVERGCALMLKGFVRSQVELAMAYWGDDYEVFLTGGDASVVADVLPRVRVVPDLIFIGLAIACPISS